MKRYSISVVLHILLLVVLSIGGYLLFCYELWFSTLIVRHDETTDRLHPLQ